MMPYVLIYLRVPKTASTTMWRAVLHHQYTGKKKHGGMNKLRWQTPELANDYDLIGGHGAFGLMEDVIERPIVYMVTLREPIDRTLSHYYYVLGSGKHQLSPIAQSMSMKDYFNREGADLDLGNIQTKFLSANYSRVRPTGPQHAPHNDPSMSMDMVLERAKVNLEKCLIGLQEDLPKSIEYFASILKWTQPINEGLDRKNYDRPLLKDEPQWVLDMVKERNLLDLELYALARQLWEQQFTSGKTVEDYYIY